jgi:hypothetical protein
MAVLRVPKKLTAAAQRAVDTPRPTFTPGALDAQGVSDQATLNRDTAISSTGILQTYKDIMADIEARRPRIEHEKQMGLRGNARNHADRGTIRSGMRVEDDTRTTTDATDQQLDLSNQGVRAANSYQRDSDRLMSDYVTGTANSQIGSDQRNYQQWLDRNPVTVDVNHPDITPTETVVPSWQKKPNDAVIQKRYGAAVRAVKRGPKAGGGYVLKTGG